jgi:hypothetical protein
MRLKPRLPSARRRVFFAVTTGNVVSINNCCHNALHDILSSDPFIIMIIFSGSNACAGALKGNWKCIE